MELRPYQNIALDAVMSDLRKEPCVLLQAATGAGKTIIFSEIIRRWMTQYPALGIAVVAHRQELVAQARDKLLKVWPDGWHSLGLACAGAGAVNIGRPVTIGSVQTLARRRLSRPVHLLIVDEAHRIPAVETGGQYHDLISNLRSINSDLRVLGVTATPYRLGHGYIYGDDCKAGRTNLFPRLNHQIGLAELTAAGFLVPVRAKEGANLKDDLAQIKLTHGEYDTAELNSLLLRGVHIQSAVDAYNQYGEGRDKVLVFAASIEHAEKLAQAFQAAGHQSGVVHSKMADRERRRVLHSFDHGDLKFLVNVGILTEGWDSPRVNLILMCRPTKAPALFVQMIGRGTRLHHGKNDLLVLDLAENYRTHGDPADPIVRKPGQGGGDAPVKVCPDCQAFVHASSLVCGGCGHRWQVQLVDEEKAPPMVAVELTPPGKSRVLNWKGFGHVSFKGNYMFLLELQCRPGGTIRHWLDIEGSASGYGQSMARTLWWQLSGGRSYPLTVREAANRVGELHLPQFVTIIKDRGYKAVKEFRS